ncbi:hypothetical protein BDM02DRAFT_3118004 [Thelephora ganbajun]|uniref:Uncharacterized protein n=1 Tax=Thelephora ganbajun TaxID=370292 RepID=A0ACB6ZAW7_THEGA|nr:hypothetical protein BDM02DRAFT_3118004 [Thelephora ganbajun]
MRFPSCLLGKYLNWLGEVEPIIAPCWRASDVERWTADAWCKKSIRAAGNRSSPGQGGPRMA